ncbi:MAG: hypothetical protein K2X53_05035 [Alphaproteobacteria bacterium]|nr:hypothetical protein [Alphaproteobacteria bacterium]
MGKYFKEAFARDAMVILGLTILILTLFLTLSFKSRDEELRVKYLDALQHTKVSLENSLKNDFESLKIVRLQIPARPSSSSTQFISRALKEAEGSFTLANNGFGTPYYLKIGKEILLVSSRGRIATPELSLGDSFLKIKNQKLEQSLYVDEDAFYLALKIDQDSYLILKRPREVGDKNIWQSAEYFTEKFGIQNLDPYHLFEKPIIISAIAYGSYISLDFLQSVILLPAHQPYNFIQHLQYEVKRTLFILLIGFLFLMYMAISYNRIVRKTHAHYEKDFNSIREELLEAQSLAIQEQKERVQNQRITACLEQLHQALLEFNVRFHQQCVEIREMGKILIQNLTDPEKSFLSLAEQLRLLVNIHQNADCLSYGIIKPNNKANYSLSTIVEQALALCKGEIIKSNISLTTEIESRAEDICVDRMYLTQLLVNLLRKSLERLPKEGWINVKFELKEISNKKSLKLTFEDNGFLMSPQKIKSFRPKAEINMQAFNPLNLPWSSIEAMILHYSGTLNKNESSSGVNRCDVTVFLEDENVEEAESNVVKLFGTSHAQ